jgi:hypothetical protein
MTNVVEPRDRKAGLAVVDPLETPAASREKTPARRNGRRARRLKGEEQNGTKCRFFLQATSPDSKAQLVLGEEMESEEQALVESLKRDVPFLRVEAWTAYANRQGPDMVIRKRAEGE